MYQNMLTEPFHYKNKNNTILSHYFHTYGNHPCGVSILTQAVAEEIFLLCPTTFLALKVQLVVLVMVSTVGSVSCLLFAVLLLTVPPSPCASHL